MSGRLYTTKDAAGYCGMAVQTFYNHLSAGTGPKHHKDGRLNKFYEVDLDEWNRARLVEVA